MRSLTLIGYWHDPRLAADMPDPARFIDPEWRRGDRARIVAYLRSGMRIHEDLGYSCCRLPGGPPIREMGNAELTDGVWIWPEGLRVYLDRFAVKLPDAFVAHMERQRFEIRPVATAAELAELDQARVDASFWLAWAATNRAPEPAFDVSSREPADER
jgi:hypothetical protein